MRTQNVQATASCGAETPSLINGSFERLPSLPTPINNEDWRDFNSGNPPRQFLLVKDTVSNDQIIGWRTTATDDYIELQRQVVGYEQDGTDSLTGYWDRKSPQAADGQYWAELNAYETAALYQDLQAVQGETYYWSILHRGRVFNTSDVMKVLIGPVGSLVEQTSITKFSPTNANRYVGAPTFPTTGVSVSTISTRLEDGWTKYQGAYTASASGSLRFQFEAVTASFANRVGNLLDGITFSTFKACDATRSLNVGDVIDVDLAQSEFVYGDGYSVQSVTATSGVSGTVSTNGSVARFTATQGGTTVVTYTVSAILGGVTVTRSATITYVVAPLAPTSAPSTTPVVSSTTTVPPTTSVTSAPTTSVVSAPTTTSLGAERTVNSGKVAKPDSLPNAGMSFGGLFVLGLLSSFAGVTFRLMRRFDI